MKSRMVPTLIIAIALAFPLVASADTRIDLQIQLIAVLQQLVQTLTQELALVRQQASQTNTTSACPVTPLPACATYTSITDHGCTIGYQCTGAASTDSTTIISTHTNIWTTKSATIDPTALPLGNQKYVTTAAKKGYLFACDPYMYNQAHGFDLTIPWPPWVNTTAHTIDITKKIYVQGANYYPNAQFSVTLSGSKRMITSNGYPVGLPAGNFPIAASDPAHQYDGNPNAISAQNISFSIPSNPTVASVDSCVYKSVGITLDGVELQTYLGDTGNDEIGITEQDSCNGLSQPGGMYHRHFFSECTPHMNENNALVGYALDGFGIFSPFDANGKELTSADLDECHGITSQIMWDGKSVTMYHYVMTRDYPYTISCFKGTPTRNAFPALPGAPPEGVVPPNPSASASCSFNGQTIANGATINAYVSQGARGNAVASQGDYSCTAYPRTCSNGTLTGEPTATYSLCTPVWDSATVTGGQW